jgi:hypothetical protein
MDLATTSQRSDHRDATQENRHTLSTSFSANPRSPPRTIPLLEEKTQDICPACSSPRETLSPATSHSPLDKEETQVIEEAPSPAIVAEPESTTALSSVPDRARDFEAGSSGASGGADVRQETQCTKGKDRWRWLKAFIRFIRPSRVGRRRAAKFKPHGRPRPIRPDLPSPSSLDDDSRDPSTFASFLSEESSSHTHLNTHGSPNRHAGGAGIGTESPSPGHSPTMFGSLGQALISGGAFYAAQNITIYVNPVYHGHPPSRSPSRATTQQETRNPGS